MADSVRVVGVGNPSRGDDGIGPAVAAEVAIRVDSSVDVVVSTSDPHSLIERWGSADTVVLVDAMVHGGPPGTVTVFDAALGPLPADIESVSSHGMGIPAAVELARSLGRLPEHLVVVGVAGREFEGIGMTREVRGAVEDAVRAVMEVVEHA